MKVVGALVIACAIALTGCSFKAKWRDTTGQGRSQDQATSDARECYPVAGYDALSKNSSSDEFQAAFAKLKGCMGGKGWELVRDNTN